MERKQYLDINKGEDILLVVLDHTIQYFSGLDERSVFGLTVERIINSFHMTLLMLISGYIKNVHGLTDYEYSKSN